MPRRAASPAFTNITVPWSILRTIFAPSPILLAASALETSLVLIIFSIICRLDSCRLEGSSNLPASSQAQVLKVVLCYA